MDTIDGGEGFDIVQFWGNVEDLVMEQVGPDSWSVAYSWSGEPIQITGVEMLRFDNGNIYL